MEEVLKSALEKIENIKKRSLTIYDEIEVDDASLWLTNDELEAFLDIKLKNLDLGKFALRTRSKEAKTKVCEALNYPVPKSFKKIQPRFYGQKFDTYVQKANNLQVWNEELDATRRYVLIRLNQKGLVTQVKVVTGSDLVKLDTTGTLTQKFQARLDIGENPSELISSNDTEVTQRILNANDSGKITLPSNPALTPTVGNLFSIKNLYDLLKTLVGEKITDSGIDQERNRGAELQRLVCSKLGYQRYRDDGQFPDIRNQLLEVKLQTSPTIDLGLVNPNSESLLSIPKVCGMTIRHCDVRYALFYGKSQNGEVQLTHFFLTTGKDFFSRFQQFKGKGINKKIQIPLRKDFFIDLEETFGLDFD
ncbi:MAG: restriction endonuclease [Bacteroidota bacterium]